MQVHDRFLNPSNACAQAHTLEARGDGDLALQVLSFHFGLTGKLGEIC
jgi:hypothetical protein